MRHIREFDGVRGLLAFWVFAAHAIELGPFGDLAGHLRALYAVDVFIILSGFVIFHLLSRGEDFVTFITRRFFRIFPVFAVCFLFSLLLREALHSSDVIIFGVPQGAPRLFPYLASHAMLLHGAIPEEWLTMSATAGLPPAWSISLEWQFYLLAPLLFALMVRPRWPLALLFLALVGIRVLCERHMLGLLLPGGPRDLTFGMRAFLPLKLEYFAIGVASWALWHAVAEGKLRAQPWFTWLALVAAPLVWCGSKSLPAALWTGLFLLLLQTRSAEPDKIPTAIAGVLSTKPAQWLGAISYSFYLVHMPTIALVRFFLGTPHWLSNSAMNVAVLAFVSLGVSLLFAWLLHVAIEKPMMEFGKRLTMRWRMPVQPAIGAAAGRPLTVRNSPD